MSKIVIVCIVYDLDSWPRNPTNNFKFKNCLLGATSIVKNSDKEKYKYSDHGIKFDIAGLWNFNNGTARNVTMFGADGSSSSHAEDRKSFFFVLGEGLLLEVMELLVHKRNSLVLMLVTQTQNLFEFLL